MMPCLCTKSKVLVHASAAIYSTSTGTNLQPPSTCRSSSLPIYVWHRAWPGHTSLTAKDQSLCLAYMEPGMFL